MTTLQPVPILQDSLSNLVHTFLEKSTSYQTVWIRENTEGAHSFEVFAPSENELTEENAQKAFITTLSVLKIYKRSIQATDLSHIQFLGSLPKSFTKFHEFLQVGQLNQKIQKILTQSHVQFHHERLSSTTPILEHYQEMIHWDQLPYDPSTRQTLDAVFLLGDEMTPIPVHSSKIVSEFPYFQALLVSPLRLDPLANPIKIPDESPKTFSDFLFFVYRNQYPSDLESLINLGIFFDKIDHQHSFALTSKKILSAIEKWSLSKLLDTFLALCQSHPRFSLCESIHNILLDRIRGKDYIRNSTDLFCLRKINDKTYVVEYKISFSKEEQSFVGRQRLIKKSQVFKMLGTSWSVNIFEEAENGVNHHGIYLKIEESTHKKITFTMSTYKNSVKSVSKLTHTYTPTSTTWGLRYGEKGKGSSLYSILEDDTLHIEFKIKLVED